MSQIPKNKIRVFADGGATESKPTQSTAPKTYGKVIINGREQTVTEDWLNQFDTWLGNQSQEVQRGLSPVRDKIIRGETVDHNAFADQTSANVLDDSNLSAAQKRRMTKQRSGAGMFFDALFNSKVQRQATALQAFDNFKYQEPVTPKPKKEVLDFSNREIDFNTDEKGAKRYVSSASNIDAISRLSKLNELFDSGLTDEEIAEKYDIKGNLNLSSLRNFRNSNRSIWDSLEGRITSAQTDDDTWDYLRDLGLTWQGNNPDAVAQAEAARQAVLANETEQQRFDRINQPYGLNQNWAGNLGDYFQFDDEGKLNLDKLQRDRFYYFGDHSPMNADSPYFGGGAYNGKLYTKAELDANPELQNLWRGFRDNLRKTGVVSDSDKINFYWGQVTPENNPFEVYEPNKKYLKGFHGVLYGGKQSGANPMMSYNYLNPQYYNPDLSANPDSQLIQWQDVREADPTTGLGKMRYAVYDPSKGVTEYDTNPWVKRDSIATDVPTLQRSDWGQTKYGRQRYAKISSTDKGDGLGGYNFFIGDKDGRVYIENNGDYYLVEDFDIYKRLMDKQPVDVNEIEKMFKNKILYTDKNKFIAKPGEAGYRGTIGLRSFRSGDVGGVGLGTSTSNWTNQDWTKFLSDLTSAQKTAGFKKGGKINKLQFGGSLVGLGKAQFGGIKTTETDPSIRDITKTKIFGDGQGLTSSDKLELASMGADLAGLAATFVPGAGNIAGAGLGLAGTGMAFAADVKRDGLDWGDVGRGMVGLGLDLVTLIPGLGSAAKAGKAARAIRAGGKAVLKALAIGSAGQGAITAAQKIISGDKWTMSDLRTVVAGLQGGVGVGRGIKQNVVKAKTYKASTNARIAADPKVTGEINRTGLKLKGSDEGLQSWVKGQKDAKGKFIKKPAVKTELETDLKLTKEDIKKFDVLDTAGKRKFLVDKLVAEQKFKITDDEADRLIKEIPTSKQVKAGANVGKKGEDGKRGWVGKVFGGKVKADVAEKPIGLARAMRAVNDSPLSLRLFRRNVDAINQTTRTPFGLMREMRLANPNMSKGSFAYKYSQHVRSPYSGMTNITFLPNYDVRTWEDRNYKPAFKEGGKIQKLQTGSVLQRRLEDSPAITNWGSTISDFAGRNWSFADLDYLNKTRAARQAIGNQRRGSAVANFQGIYDNSLFTNIIDKVAQTYGKTAAKGQYNASTRGAYNQDGRRAAITNSWIDADRQLETYAGNADYIANAPDGSLIFTNGAYSLKNRAQQLPIFNDDPNVTQAQLDANHQMRTPTLAGSQTLAEPTVQTRATGNQPVSGVGQQTNNATMKLGNLGINPDNIASIANLAMSIGHNNRQARVQKDAIRTAMGSMEQNVAEVYPRFTDYGLNAAYENAATQQLNVKPATNDILKAHAIEQGAKNQADQLRLEGKLKTSELFSNFLNRTDELRRNYSNERTAVDNRNRQRLAQLNMALAETESGRIANNHQSWTNWIQEKRANWAKDEAQRERYDNAILQANLQNDQTRALNDFYAAYTNEYEALPDVEKAKYQSKEDYVNQKYPELVRTKSNEMNIDLLTKFRDSQSRYGTGLSSLNWLTGPFKRNTEPFIQYNAKGGKAPRKTLNAAEEIWIQQNKDVADAVKKIHQNVIMLFMKATT